MGDGPEDRLTNLRFADDILIVATSREMVQDMVSDLQVAAAKVGLQLHVGKTKILTNEFARQSSSKDSCLIHGQSVEILGQDASTRR